MIDKPFIILLLALIAVHFTSAIGGRSKYPIKYGYHRIEKGARHQGDSVLFTDRPAVESKVMRTTKNVYCYPPQGSTDNVKITRYEVQDQDPGTSGGVAFVVSGDAGLNQVCFLLKSRKGNGYRFLVNVYGNRYAPNKQSLGGFTLPKEEEEEDDDDDNEKEKKQEKKKVGGNENVQPKQTTVVVSVNIPHH